MKKQNKNKIELDNTSISHDQKIETPVNRNLEVNSYTNEPTLEENTSINENLVEGNTSETVNTNAVDNQEHSSKIFSINDRIKILEKLKYVCRTFPFFIVSFSRPTTHASRKHKVISAISIHVNPEISKHCHIPIDATGINFRLQVLNDIKLFVIITNNKYLASLFTNVFNKYRMPIAIHVLESIEHLMHYQNLIENKYSINIVYFIYFISWADVASEFAKHGYNITGGKTGQRHVISPLTFRFVKNLIELGYDYEQIKHLYSNIIKENIHVRNNNQQIANNIAIKLIESLDINPSSKEDLDRFNNQSENSITNSLK